ncbi:MAG TPA: 2-oxoacid:acceptor oxidoreductase family protein, partial [Nitrospira sp.]|nr:2-oxoacid:acceptor oxidoreductase family protein [Nitrospira sp.]
MRAVRFHGRGGQGAKTASRILGTAAYLEGFVAQDSPIYGAERRGAPVAAFTRVDTRAIRERGMIFSPALVVVADATLLDDPSARVLEGVREATALFVNSAIPADQLRTQFGIPGHLTTLDVTGMVLQYMGKSTALSAPLGAVAARLLGLHVESLRTAIQHELTDLGLAEPVIAKNQHFARSCYEAVSVVPVTDVVSGIADRPSLWRPSYDPPTRGTPMISAAANTVLRKTGGWRTFRPVLLPDKCNGCFLCFTYCPEGAIAMTSEGKPVIDYDHCKGCMLCVEECPTDALLSRRESEV